VVNADEVEAQVDADGHACRLEDVAVDEYPVRLDVYARVLPAKPVRYLLADGHLARVQFLQVRWTFTGLLRSPATSVIHTCTSLWLWVEVPQPRLNG
jgi:hypothetical protein